MSTKDGDYLGGIRTLEDIRKRCWVSECGCWVWRMGLSHGRPNASVIVNGKRRSVLVRRHALTLSGKHVFDHLCVVPGDSCEHKDLCVNPRHMRVVTLDEVRRSTVTEETRARLRSNGLRQRNRKLSKLSADQVKQILSRRDEKREELAKEFGVCRATIYNILGGHCWKDVAGIPINSVFSLGADALRLSLESGAGKRASASRQINRSSSSAEAVPAGCASN